MQSFSLKVQLASEVTDAITHAVNDAFTTAKQQLATGSSYPMYMNTSQAAAYLGISFNTIKKWMRLYPNFPVKVIDGTYHFNREKLDEFMTVK